jgi:hypothetical protein
MILNLNTPDPSLSAPPARIMLIKLRLFSHPYRGENNNEHSFYVGHDAGGLSQPLDTLVIDPSCTTFLQLRASIEESCDGNVAIRRTFFTEFINLMHRCHNFHDYDGEALKTYRLGVLGVESNKADDIITVIDTIKLIKSRDETKLIKDICSDGHDIDIVLIPTTQIHPTSDRLAM